METISIECSPSVKAKILEFLNSFSKEEYKVVDTSYNYEEKLERLRSTDQKITNGTAGFCSFEEIDAHLNEIISSYED